MQLVQDVNQQLLNEYLGGTIVLRSHSDGMDVKLARGTLLDATFLNEEWLSVKMTCDEYASASTKDETNPVWHAAGGSETFVLVHTTVDQEDGVLHFSRQTPQGTTARVTLAETTSIPKAA